MNSYYFSCNFENENWQMRALIYMNDYLFLYEVEPEDRMLCTRFGVKFITQPKEGFLDMRCSNSVKDHFQYEQAVVAGLERYLVARRQL